MHFHFINRRKQLNTQTVFAHLHICFYAINMKHLLNIQLNRNVIYYDIDIVILFYKNIVEGNLKIQFGLYL